MALGLGTAMLIGSGISGLTGYMGMRKAAKGSKRIARAIMESARMAKQTADEQLGFMKDIYTRERQREEPFRQLLDSRILDYLKDPTLLTGSPLYRAYLEPMAQSFTTARNELMERLPKGGALFSTLGQLYRDEALARGGILGNLYNKYEDIGLNLSTQSVKPGLQTGIAGIQASTIPLRGAGILGQTVMPFYSNMMNIGLEQIGAAGTMLGRALYENFLKGGNNSSSKGG